MKIMNIKVYKARNPESEMRGALFVFSLLVMASLVLADDSSGTESIFTIAGCSTSDGEVSAGECSLHGYYYCDENSLEAWSTYGTGAKATACSYGESSYSGDEQCCPEGYICDPTELVCKLKGCSYYTIESDCESEGCVWFDDGESQTCVDGLDGLGCGVYKTSASCIKDIYNLGSEGEGAEECEDSSLSFVYCDVSFVIDGCTCGWDGGGCYLSKNITQEFFDEEPIALQCKEYFSYGACTNNERTVSWTSSLNDLSTGVAPTAAQLACLEDKVCEVSGSKTTGCGHALLKLPGFSFFAFVSSLFLIFGIYYLRRK